MEEEVKLDSTGFPSTTIPPKKRGDKWYVAMGREIWKRHQALMANTNSSFNSLTRIGAASGTDTPLSKANELRRMAAGAQSTSHLIQKHELTKQDGKSQTAMNVDWSSVGMGKKYTNLYVQFLMEPGYDPEVSVLDPTARDEEMNYKAAQMAKLSTLEWQNKNLELFGLPAQQVEEGMPQTFEELEVYMEMGGYKNMLADAMEKVVKFVRQKNAWDSEIFPQLVREFASVGLVGLSNYVTASGEIKYSVIPIERLVIPTIERGTWDSSKIPYAGELRKMTKDQLKRVAGNKLNDTQIEEAMSNSASAYMMGGNAYASGWRDNDSDLYSEVLYWQFFAEESTKYKVHKTSGGAVTKKVDDDWEPSGNPKVSKATDTYRQVYEGYWVIGTDIVFACGPSTHVPRQANDDYELRLHIDVFSEYTVSMTWRSAVSVMKEFIRKIDECWLQIDNQLGHIVPPGVRYDVMAMLGTGVETEMALRTLKQTGNIGYNSKFAEESMIPLAARDMIELHAGFFPAAAVSGLLEVISACKSLLEDMIGFNDATNAGTASPEALVRVQQQQAQGTVRSTAYAVQELRRGIRSSSWSTMGRIQSLVSSGKHNFKAGVGGITTTVIDRLGDMPMASMGMDVVVGANQAEKLEINEIIKMGIANQQIMPWDAMLIRTLPTYRGQMSMMKIIWKRAMKQAQEQQQQAQEMELQKIAEANKGQAELLQMKSQLHIQEQLTAMEKKFEHAMAEKDRDFENTQAELAAKAQAKLDEAMVKIDGILANTREVNAGAIEKEKLSGETKIEVQEIANRKPVGSPSK